MSYLRASDGVSIHLRELGRDDAARTLVIVHGYGEHGGRYLERAQGFADRGFRVLIPDVRGHGKSGGPRGYVAAWDHYLSDLALVLDAASESETYLLGHSNGGLIVVSYLLSRTSKVRRAAVTSPFFGVGLEPPAWKLKAAQILSRWAPRISFPTEIDPSDVSTNPATVASYAADPLNHSVNNARWYTEALAAQAACFGEVGKLATPLLVMQAGDDRLVAPEATERWAESAAETLVRYECIADAYHELLFEADGDRHAERIRCWLEDRDS